MKILHIASGDFFSTYGGGQVYVKNIADAMIGLGERIAIVSLIGGFHGIIEREYNGAQLVEIGSENDLEAVIEQTKPQVIHAHSIKDRVCEIGNKLGIPVVVTAHHGGILCPAGTRLNCRDEICHLSVNHKSCLPCVLRNTRTGLRWWYPLMRNLSENSYARLGKLLESKPFIPFITPIGSAALSILNKKAQFQTIARYCSTMIAPSREIAKAMEQNGLEKEKIRIVPHGIPLPPTRPDYPEVSDGKVKFYYVGRICYVKGIHILLNAFRKVENPHIELHLIGGAGNKQERRYMSELQKRHSGDRRIVWHGKIAPKAVFEATANYHVSSSSSICLEAFGLNIAEALALGKPVLATQSGGAEMQITDGMNGWLVPTNDSDALAEKISYVATHPELLRKMSAHCNAISIREHCEQLLDIYKQCISQPL